MNLKRIRTLIIDDSAVVRRVVTEQLSRFRDIEVVGTAIDPYFARDKILELNPDVITLDIEMPRMDGLTFLKLLMKHRPMPVVILSSLTTEGSRKALEALQAGAVEVLDKPNGSFSSSVDGERLAGKIRAAAQARVSSLARTSVPEARPVSRAARPPDSAPARLPTSVRKIILLGASTGGTEALKTVLTSLPENMPPICVVQHIPAHFSRAFANRLNELCALEVREAQSGDLLKPGLALIAPGGYHLVLQWRVNHYEAQLNEGPMLHHQRPAVDVLFNSVALAGGGGQAFAALLTGMGADGAAGLLKLREAGAITIAQNEETCVVYGMPREAVRLGAAQQVLPLQAIGARLCDFAAKGV